jgi:hypothetical protein
MLQSLILIDGLSSVYQEKKREKERETVRELFSRAEMPGCLYHARIFLAVRCN